MRFGRATLAMLALIVPVLPACEGGDAGSASAAPRLGAGLGIPSFALRDARLEVAHTGLRRIETAEPRALYREYITTDGQGRFAIDPFDSPDSSVGNWELFALIQKGREGFNFRYRDFTVRDRLLFARQWVCRELGPGSVAGRSCLRYRIEQRAGAASFELAVDHVNDLILSSKEYSGAHLVASMVYESLDAGPERPAVVWHVPGNQEKLLDPAEDLVTQLERPALEPRLLPDGYVLLEAATVGDGTDDRWLKLTFTDGVYPLFFMQNLSPRIPGRTLLQGAHVLQAERLAPSTVSVYQMGSAMVAQGEVDGHELIAIGKVGEAELLDLLESSLP